MKIFGRPVAACTALPFVALTACSGGGSGSGILPAARIPSDVQGSMTAQAAVSPRDASETMVAFGPAPDSGGSSDLLYVSNAGTKSITVYRHDAQGNTAPLFVIAGSKTQLGTPGQLSEDAAGHLYVANGPSVLVFAHGANGNVAPLRVLAGSKAGFQNSAAVTVDRSTGKIFVADNYDPNPFFDNLLRFAPNAAGDVAPFATQNNAPTNELASDSTGLNLIEADAPIPNDAWSAGTATVPKQFANRSSQNVGNGVESLYSFGVADDATTKTYLVSSSDGIYRFAETTSGYGPLNLGSAPPHYSPAPVAVITSAPSCGQLALGYLRNIYAVCGNAVKVFEATANGAAAPLRTLTGSATKLDAPVGIYEGP